MLLGYCAGAGLGAGELRGGRFCKATGAGAEADAEFDSLGEAPFVGLTLGELTLGGAPEGGGAVGA